MCFISIAPEAAGRIRHDSPELLFLDALCSGQTGRALAFFEENAQFQGASVVDAPQGRYEGLDGIAALAQRWLKDFSAQSARVEPVTQTTAGGRSATEALVHFQREAGEYTVPVMIVGDLRPNGKLDGARIYFYYQWMPGLSAYRRIIFQPAHDEPAPFALMTGSARRYFELLHDEGDVAQRIERIIDITTPDVAFGGYRTPWSELPDAGHAAIRAHYEGICADAPRNFIVRAEAITDDGIQCVVEWTLVVTAAGYATGRVAQSGVAVYERDPVSGLLRSIRICDNVGNEDDIRLDELPDDVRPLVAAYRASKK